MEFSLYSKAEDCARQKSKENPGVVWYVNWLETDDYGNDTWDVSIYNEYDSQRGYLNGFDYTPEGFEDY